MYVIAKPFNSPDVWDVVSKVSIKGDEFGTIPGYDLSVDFFSVSGKPAFVDDFLSALIFEYPEQAYSLLVTLGLAGAEISCLEVLSVEFRLEVSGND